MISRRLRALVITFLLLVSGGCSERNMSAGAQSQAHNSAPATHTSAPSPFVITASIKELMDSTVDPAADSLWDAVSSTSSTTDGFVEHRPRTDEDWKELRRHALTLIEATNLIVMDGRHSAPAGTTPGPGELTPEEIDQRITATRRVFVELAHGLRTTALTALAAIDRRDAGALFDVGGDIDAACEACHLNYWYPNQSEGGSGSQSK